MHLGKQLREATFPTFNACGICKLWTEYVNVFFGSGWILLLAGQAIEVATWIVLAIVEGEAAYKSFAVLKLYIKVDIKKFIKKWLILLY